MNEHDFHISKGSNSKQFKEHQTYVTFGQDNYIKNTEWKTYSRSSTLGKKRVMPIKRPSPWAVKKSQIPVMGTGHWGSPLRCYVSLLIFISREEIIGCSAYCNGKNFTLQKMCNYCQQTRTRNQIIGHGRPKHFLGAFLQTVHFLWSKRKYLHFKIFH